MVEDENAKKKKGFLEGLKILEIGKAISNPNTSNWERFIYKKLSLEETIERCKNLKDGKSYSCHNCHKWLKHEQSSKDDYWDRDYYLCFDCSFEIVVLTKDSGY